MKKRSFLLPLATAISALLGVTAPAVKASPVAPPVVASAAEPGIKAPAPMASDLVIERSNAKAKKFAQHYSHRSHGSHSSHSSHRSHYSSR